MIHDLQETIDYLEQVNPAAIGRVALSISEFAARMAKDPRKISEETLGYIIIRGECGDFDLWVKPPSWFHSASIQDIAEPIGTTAEQASGNPTPKSD